MWILRGRVVALARPLTTPGLGRVVTTVPYLCPASSLTRCNRRCRRLWCRLESTIDWLGVCLPHSFEQLSFLIGTHHHRPRFKIRVSRVFGQGSCRVNNACSPTDSYHPPGAKPTRRMHRLAPVRPVPWSLGNRLTRRRVEPSRVLWIGRLPKGISQAALTDPWSRLGYVVEVCTCT